MRTGRATRTSRWLLFAGLALFLTSACKASSQPDPAAPEYKITGTVQDIMDSMVDPNADLIWESVATIVSATGTEERQPRTADDWAKVRRSAITIIEATNLLQMPGRLVAKHGVKSENPGIELEPEEIEKLIAEDRVAWKKLSHGLHEAAAGALAAIEAKNVEGLLDAGEKLDQACESCHLKYWYPNTTQAAEAAKATKS